MAATGEEVVTYKQLMNWGKTLSGGGEARLSTYGKATART